MMIEKLKFKPKINIIDGSYGICNFPNSEILFQMIASIDNREKIATFKELLVL